MMYIYGVILKNCGIELKYKGISDYPVSMVNFKDISAPVSYYPESTIKASEKNILRHELIVEKYFNKETILPFRFGTIVSYKNTVRDILEKRYEDFISNLVRLNDTVEFGLTVLWDNSETTADDMSQGNTRSLDNPAGQGTQYIQGIYEKHLVSNKVKAKGEEIINIFNKILKIMSVEYRINKFPTDDLLFKSAYLVKKSNIRNFQSLVNAHSREYKLLLTGPWPPYNFVNNNFD
ncbi:MAG: GvpL/GvpF family gas vesicle protein [Candidatus Marinimicrobia bacterium]|nr:GvpL/GvpF family gas vesicle protein [Candidatus Neomarinimicrobiota bacterium]